MLDVDTLHQLSTASIEERIAIIEMILKSLKQDLQASNAPTIAEQHPLRGTVSHYDAPYEPVAAEDMDSLQRV